MQGQRDEILAVERDFPDALAEPLRAAMQRMFAEEVGVGLIVLAGDRETAAANAIGVAAGRRAEIRGMRGIVVESVEAQHERGVVALKPEVLERRTPADDVCGQPAAADREALYFLAL